MSDVVTIGLAGISGYGDEYLGAMLAKMPADGFRLAGCVDPYPQRCRRLADLGRLNVPIFGSTSELFEAADIGLMILSTPLHLHVEQICQSLAAGANVLCEKPLAATVEGGLRALRAERRSGRFVGIGFQWSFSEAIGTLKRDLLAGLFGRPLRFASMAVYPRGSNYYARNGWAGREHTAAGAPIFDSPANNATAHFLHNMLYVLGATPTTSAHPATVEAELYRVNPIESYDTAMIRCRTTGGTELSFATSHASPRRVGPLFRLECERATVTFGEHEPLDEVIARYHDGRVVCYGRPERDRLQKLWQSIEVARRGGGSVACGIRAALPHAMCVAAARQCRAPAVIDDAFVTDGQSPDGPTRIVRDIEAILDRCYTDGLLPSETGVGWARRSRVVDVDLSGLDEPREADPVDDVVPQLA